MRIVSPLASLACTLALCAALPAGAATISFSGEIDLVLEDTGTGDLAGLGVGTPVSGTIDDATFAGSVTDGTGTVTFDCCIAAGGLSVSNDVVLDADTAAAANAVQSVRAFAAGDVIDLIDIEGDTDTDSGRIEVGLSFVFDAATFADDDLANYPFDPADLLFTLFFLLEEDIASDTETYSALGLVDVLTLPDRNGGPGPSVVPLPSALLLGLTALGGLAALRRRTTSRPGRA